MKREKIQQILRALRLLVPTFSEMAYVYKIRRSGLFDRQFYSRVNPALHPLCVIFPERHYVQRGERQGLQPNPNFSPLAYLRHNADLRDWVTQPLLHYIDFGRHEQRITKDLPISEVVLLSGLPVPRRSTTARHTPPPFAVVVHLYYHELWPEISERLKQQAFDFDLFVTYTVFPNDESAIMAEVLRDFPNALVVPLPNHGRDIFPFVHIVNSGLLSGYRAICKIHTKKSPHRLDGETWRRHLITGILGNAKETQLRLERFLERDTAAIWVADGQHYSGMEWWGSNNHKVDKLLQRVGIQPDHDKLSFPAGSMYWIKPLMLERIRDLHLGPRDFDAEYTQVDGTVAHAFERALGYLVQAADRQIVQSAELDAQSK